MGKQMTIDQLKKQFEFRQLTAKQQAFVLAYIETSNSTEAAKVAYETKNPQIMGCQVIARPAIQFVLGLFYGASPNEAFARYLWKQITNKQITNQQVEAMRLYADVRGMRNAHTNGHAVTEVKRRIGKKVEAEMHEDKEFLAEFETTK
jgi:Terminase small subunit